MEIVSVTNEGLGHSSHVVDLGDGTVLVVDPARLPDHQRRLVAERRQSIAWTADHQRRLVAERRQSIAWTADTHSHADYISGSFDLAADGARFLAPARARLEADHHGLEPTETVELANGILLRAIATPGHTPEHLSYLLIEHGEPVALFSGGSLMVGTVGRTDLLGDDRAEPLAREMHQALHQEILTLPDDLPVYPTHGAGSFCSAPGTAERTTTIGWERATNPLLAIADEDEFVDRLLRGLGSFPSYFRALPERNRHGPRVYPAVPTLDRLPANTAATHVARGAVLVDARPVDEFAAGHPAGAVSNALRPVFGSWLGWLVPLDTPLVFLLDDDQDRSDLVRQCLTVGHEHLVGEVDGGLGGWAAAGAAVTSIPLVMPDTMSPTVLDVRQTDEWRLGHLPRATHVELGTLATLAPAGGTPASDGGAPAPDGPVTVMCGHGERAMTAASLLAARGHRDLSVLAGGPDDWSRASGEPLVSEP